MHIRPVNKKMLMNKYIHQMFLYKFSAITISKRKHNCIYFRFLLKAAIPVRGHSFSLCFIFIHIYSKLFRNMTLLR